MDRTHDAYARGWKLVRPFLHLEGRPPPITPNQSLREGIEFLEASRDEAFWEANWLLGKAYEAAGEYEKSAECFRQAYVANSARREIIHEYVVALLRTNHVVEAVEVAETTAGEDPLLAFDYALALCAAG